VALDGKFVETFSLEILRRKMRSSGMTALEISDERKVAGVRAR
jgi:hypothetical protein